MKRHRLPVSLVIVILILGSLVVVGFVAAPDISLEQNPQAEDYNSSRSNTATSISVGEDTDGNLWIGIVRTTEDGVTQIGTHNGNSVEVSFSEFGDLIVSEPRQSPEFDGLILEAIDEAFSVWERGVTTAVGEIELAVEKVERAN